MQGVAAGSVDNGGRLLAKQEVRRRRSLCFQFELEEILTRWVGEDIAQDSLGNLQPVWQIMLIQGLNDRDKLERYLGQVRLHDVHKDYFSPLPHTIATYLIEIMLTESWDQASMEEAMNAKGTEELQRFKIRVIRDSFLWLGELVDATGTWAWMLLPSSDVQREKEIRDRLRWLQHENTKKFYRASPLKPALNEEDLSNLEALWNLFEEKKGSHLLIRFAFCLAQLEAMGSWGERGNWETQGWPEYYNQVINGLL
ncbi:hypothetical protein BJX63DRAFT_182699 [Aspergillus granulosus]|uniref:Uncharacterized protein n=1 Tax=Aspergillus granulosus TaxID=176169 RepID=A0ABR4I2X0_9EURO